MIFLVHEISSTTVGDKPAVIAVAVICFGIVLAAGVEYFGYSYLSTYKQLKVSKQSTYVKNETKNEINSEDEYF